MTFLRKLSDRIFGAVLLVMLMCSGMPAMAQDKVVVAVVTDGPADRLQEQHALYTDELLALTANEFDIEIRRFVGDWSKESALAAINAAYADDAVDLVLMTGFVANQLAATFPIESTFCPVRPPDQMFLAFELLRCCETLRRFAHFFPQSTSHRCDAAKESPTCCDSSMPD